MKYRIREATVADSGDTFVTLQLVRADPEQQRAEGVRLVQLRRVRGALEPHQLLAGSTERSEALTLPCLRR